jgi:hypothetical protein
MRKIVLGLFIFGSLLAGCGQVQPATPDTGAPTSGAATQPPTSVPAAPTVMPTAVPPTVEASQPGATPDAMLAEARARLAAHLGVKEDALAVQSTEAKQWPDGAIGCPQAGMMYPQIVTPGYLIVFSHNGTSYDVHTGREDVFILCQNNKPTPLNSASQEQPTAHIGNTPNRRPTPQPTDQPTSGNPAVLGPAASAMAAMARTALASSLGIDANNVSIVSAEEVQWSDGSLGCPQPGMMYPQVITPGFKITLEASGKSYTYHTDTRQHVIRCDNPSPRGQVTK